MTAAGAALTVTVVAALGGIGILPTDTATARPTAPSVRRVVPASDTGSTPSSTGGSISLALANAKPPVSRTGQELPLSVPEDSGSGRRIVFDVTDQRVWLVDERAGRDVVRRTYLVSGSVTDNLDPGTYSVYSKSKQAWGVDDSGSMRYMVRFAHGSRAAIGFHDIPMLDGAPVQTVEELGAPRSHGCIRQTRPDAHALWAFAPVGTKVVVTA
jgi:lipoprotein-anchoring transpeptidase ErfK/SrfK